MLFRSEVVVTELDHHANIDPWKRLAHERGVTVKQVKVDVATGELDWVSFESCLGPRTRLVAIGAASNALGTMSDIPRAVRAAQAVGALTYVDAVHFTPHATGNLGYSLQAAAGIVTLQTITNLIGRPLGGWIDRKSTRLNSSHLGIRMPSSA